MSEYKRISLNTEKGSSHGFQIGTSLKQWGCWNCLYSFIPCWWRRVSTVRYFSHLFLRLSLLVGGVSFPAQEDTSCFTLRRGEGAKRAALAPRFYQELIFRIAMKRNIAPMHILLQERFQFPILHFSLDHGSTKCSAQTWTSVHWNTRNDSTFIS